MIVIFKPNKKETSSVRKKKCYKSDREVAAFILDRPTFDKGKGFGFVPSTRFMRVKFFDGNITTDCERGSLQQYILNQECKHKPKVCAIENV